MSPLYKKCINIATKVNKEHSSEPLPKQISFLKESSAFTKQTKVNKRKKALDYDLHLFSIFLLIFDENKELMHKYLCSLNTNTPTKSANGNASIKYHHFH